MRVKTWGKVGVIVLRGRGCVSRLFQNCYEIRTESTEMNASHVAMGSSLRNASSAERETRRRFLERGVSRGRLSYFPQMTDGRSEKPTLVRAHQWTPRALCLPLLITHATWGATKDRVEAYPVSACLRIPLTAPGGPISRWARVPSVG